MFEMNYRGATRLASTVTRRFRVSRPDSRHGDLDWHFAFLDPDTAIEFSYRARCNGFNTVSDLDGNVWITFPRKEQRR